MPVLLQVCAVVVTLAIAAIAIGVLRAIRTFTEVAADFGKTADVVRATVAEVDVVVRQIKELAGSMEGVVAPLKQSAENLGAVGNRAARISNALLDEVAKPISNTVALMSGVRMGTRSLIGALSRRLGHATSNGGYNHE